MCSDFYFSKIETFDQDDLLNPAANKKNERKEARRNKKLENMGIFIGRDSVKTLKKAEEFEQKLAKLKSENPDMVTDLNQRKAWQLARLKAQGVKLKTDVSKIRKSVQKTKNMKKKSSQKWKARNDKVKAEQKTKQAKRQRNLQIRSDKKRAKKYKKLVKKGHILPQLPKE